MKPPHWLCKTCGIIINDSGSEPHSCTYCNNSGFIYCGYENDYDPVDIRAEHGISFNPDKFSSNMSNRFWEGMSSEEKVLYRQKIDEMNDKIKERNPISDISNLF